MQSVLCILSAVQLCHRHAGGPVAVVFVGGGDGGAGRHRYEHTQRPARQTADSGSAPHGGIPNGLNTTEKGGRQAFPVSPLFFNSAPNEGTKPRRKW